MSQLQSESHRVTDPSPRGAVIVLTVIAMGAALKLTASVTMPLSFALFLAMILWPAQRYLERFVPSGIALLGTLLLACTVAAGIVGLLMISADSVAQRAPYYADRLAALKRDIIHTAETWGLTITEADLGLPSLAEGLGTGAVSVVRAIAVRAGFIVLTLGFLVLAMLEVRRWRARLADTLEGGKVEGVFRALSSIADGSRSYVATRTITSAATGVVTALFLWACGVDFPLLWGAVAYLLNYIPTVGSLVAVTPPSILATLQYGSLGVGIGVLAGQTVLQLVIGQYIDPRLQGKNLRMSPLLVLFAIMFWGWMWGAAGALIAIPLTVTLVIACRQFEGSRWIAEMAADDG